MLYELSLDSMKHVAAGKVDAAVTHHLKRAAEDCYDRPGCDSAREVQITIKVKPQIDQDGLCESVNTEYEVSSKVPKHVSAPVNCGLRKGGKMVFNDMSEGDIHQKTIDE